jgi:hypothetical protein
MRHLYSVASAMAAAIGAPSWNPFAAISRDLTPRRQVRRLYRLNRSRRWRPARTYQEARRISPFPERPVR